MTNYRNQNACANCQHARTIGGYDGPEEFFCYRNADGKWQGPGLNQSERRQLILEYQASHEVNPNGICDDYEKHIPQPKPEAAGNNGEIPF